MADTNAFYRLFGGNYPTDRVRRKQHPRVMPSEIEFDSDSYVDAYLGLYKKQLEYIHPKWFIKQYFVDDVEWQFKALAKASDYDPAKAQEVGDEEDIGGVQVGFNLNPITWIKEPKKELQGTIKGWWKNTVNWKDFESYYEREGLWEPLLKGTAVKSSAMAPFVKFGYDHDSTNQPFQLVGLNIKTQKETAESSFVQTEVDKQVVDASGNLVTVRVKEWNRAPPHIGTADVDLFFDANTDFKKFIKVSKAAFPRDKAFDTFVNSAAKASSFEIQNAIAKPRSAITNPREKLILQDYVMRARALDLANALAGKNTFSVFVLADGTKVESGYYTGLTSLSQTLAKISVHKVITDDDRKKIQGFFIDGPSGLSTLGRLQRDLKDMEEWFRNNRPDQLVSFQNYIQPLNEIKDKLLTIRDSNKKLPFLNSVEEARDLLGLVEAVAIDLQIGGIPKAKLEKLTHDFLSNANKQELKEILEKYKDDELKGTSHVLNVADEAKRVYAWEDFNDLINTLETEGVLGIASEYVWWKFRARLGRYAPQKLVQTFLIRNHYFGLMYSAKSALTGEDMTKTLFGKIINSKKMAWLFDNKQNVILDLGGGLKKSFEFVGDERLEFGVTLWRGENLTVPMPMDGATMLKIINGDKTAIEALKLADNLEWDALNAKIQDTRNWLLKHADALGLRVENGKILETDANKNIIGALFEALKQKNKGSANISIFKNKAGLLEKLAQKLNLAQTTAFKFMATLAPVAYAKKVVGRIATKKILATITRALSKLLGIAVGAATGGVSKIIWGAVEKIVQYVVKKTLDFVGKVFEAIRKADFSVIEKFIDSSIGFLYKTLGCCAGCGILALTPTAIAIIIMLSAISPVDPTRTLIGLGSGGTYTVTGPTACDPATDPNCNVEATIDCFEFVGEWNTASAQAALAGFTGAAANLSGGFGHYVDKLCAAGPILVAYGQDWGYCGGHRDGDTIYFHDGGVSGCFSNWGQTVFNYLLAHESGHVYQGRRGGFEYGTSSWTLALAQDTDGGTQTTYQFDAACSNHIIDSEDYAETIGNYVNVNINRICTPINGITSRDAWIAAFPGHYAYAQEELFAPD